MNKVLEALGGKWNRKAGGHVFDHYPADEIDEVILTGEYTDKSFKNLVHVGINLTIKICGKIENVFFYSTVAKHVKYCVGDFHIDYSFLRFYAFKFFYMFYFLS